MKNISIILPVYNSKQHLEKTLLSIVEQSYKDDIELIIVNDGSTDESIDILENYKNKYPEIIKLINKENTGVSDSRNIGIKEATGKYMTFIDSDDIYEKNYLKILYENIVEGFDLVTCSYSNFGGKQNTIKLDKSFETSDISLYLEKLQSNYLFNQLWNKIYIKEIIDKNNIRFDRNKSIAEDWEFNVKYISYCKKMKYINEPLYKYRISNAGLGFKYRKDTYLIKFKILNNTLEIFNRLNLNSLYIYECYIKQSYSFLSVIMDSRNSENYNEKIKKIKDFLNNEQYRLLFKRIHVEKINYKLMLFFLKKKCVIILSLFGIAANFYDKHNKKKKFGLKGEK